MTREIKFRGWSVELKKWVFGHYYVGLNDYHYIQAIFPIRAKDKNGRELKSFFVDDTTVGQYTGMKDASRKEVFEGDIIKVHGFQGREGEQVTEVFWWDNYGCWACRQISNDFGGKAWGYQSLEFVLRWKSEVIGNVYENKELVA